MILYTGSRWSNKRSDLEMIRFFCCHSISEFQPGPLKSLFGCKIIALIYVKTYLLVVQYQYHISWAKNIKFI